MRLIDTDTLELKSFGADDVPQYAILSHTWATDDSEVSLQEFTSRSNPDKEGWDKIRACCQKAKADEWKWVWIDTCCIDKTSSAELSEAINSMFKWYEGSAICYAYLADVDVDIDGKNEGGLAHSLRRCRWFTRGWTLQELLAPTFVLFLDRHWQEIGTRFSLEKTIKKITGIHVFGPEVLWTAASVAQKFSWAARRRTTRVEDQAYSLLGLFGVHMPLLYGEGPNAFRRLQEEIMRTSNDESIFVWEPHDPTVSDHCGALAPSVDCFLNSYDILPSSDEFRLWRNEENDRRTFQSDFSKIKEGVRITTILYRTLGSGKPHYCAPLNCGRMSRESKGSGNPCVAILLVDDEGGTFSRTRNHKVLYHFTERDGSSSEWRKLSIKSIIINDRRQTYSPLPVVRRGEDDVLVTLQSTVDVTMVLGPYFKLSRGTTYHEIDDQTGEVLSRQWQDQLNVLPQKTPGLGDNTIKVIDGWVATACLSIPGDLGTHFQAIYLALRMKCLYIAALQHESDAVSAAARDSYRENLPDTISFGPDMFGRVIEVKLRPKPSTVQARLKEYYLHISRRDVRGRHGN